MSVLLALADLFFIGSVSGWVFELFFLMFFSSSNPEHKWINPGFCIGPYVPLYGFGLCILYVLALLGDRFYQPLIQGLPNVSIVYDQTYRLLSSAYAALVCSGTATLETALFNVPQVVCYQANAVSAAIARVLIGNRIKYISLVNLIADAPVVVELIQQDFTAQRLEQEFQRILADDSYRQSVLDGYARVHSLLGNAGASDRTAAEIIKRIAQK